MGTSILRNVIAAIALAIAGVSSVAPAAAGPFETLPVPAITIYPGDIIDDDMLTEGRFPRGTSATQPVAVLADDLVGKVARRTLLPGRLVGRNAVGEPELVTRGTVVPARYEAGSLVITTTVLALQSGTFAELISVRNVDSGQVLKGLVEADGTIRIGALR